PQEESHPGVPLVDGHAVGGEADTRAALEGYFAAVSGVDRGVGRVLSTLEACGLRENTLVIFTSDNGFSCGQHGIWGKGNGTFPQSMYQESVTVPFLISQPGRIPAGQVREELLSAYDLAPTLRQWCHLPGTDDPLAAGTSFAGLLTGAEAAPERGPVVVYDEYGPVRMIRTGRWK